eukprot:Pgem_evm2s6027
MVAFIEKTNKFMDEYKYCGYWSQKRTTTLKRQNENPVTIGSESGLEQKHNAIAIGNNSGKQQDQNSISVGFNSPQEH